MYLVSACLLGVRCKYDGGSNYNFWIASLIEKNILIPVCPEQLGGLPTPRPVAEILDGDGIDVLEGHASIIDQTGRDVRKNFVLGAEEVCRLAQLLKIRGAILKSKSPSCGIGCVYDGSFTGTCRPGDGVAAAALKQAGITVYSERDFVNYTRF